MPEQGKVIVSSPGRICLFGEHQDYLGLPVIAAAVDLRATFTAWKNDTGKFWIHKPDINAEEEIDPHVGQEYSSKRDYLKSAVNVLRREGFRFDQGYTITLRSDIPIGKGCSSSSAILVAWIGLLSRIATEGRTLSPEEAALFGYYAEVKEFKEPGGMMDHFTSARGGLVRIDTKGDISLRPLGARIEGVFILGDSLQPKDTTGVLGSVRGRATGGMDYVKRSINDADWETLNAEDAEKALRDAQYLHRLALLGNLRNRDITREAQELLESDGCDPAALGALLTEEHKILSANLGISTERIDKMVGAALDAGAWGAKINGSGGGGCMFAYTDEENVGAVVQGIESAGGKAAPVRIDSGLKEEAG
jgi:galactokinase